MTEDRAPKAPAVIVCVQEHVINMLMGIAIIQMARREGGDFTEFRAVLAASADGMTIGGPTFARLIANGEIDRDDLEALVRPELTDAISVLLSQAQRFVDEHAPTQPRKH